MQKYKYKQKQKDANTKHIYLGYYYLDNISIMIKNIWAIHPMIRWLGIQLFGSLDLN